MKTIPLKGVAGKLDHLAVDSKGERLYVANKPNNTLDIVDLATGKLIRQVADQGKVSGVAFSSDLNLIYVGNGAGTCNAFDRQEFKLVFSTPAPNAASNVPWGRTGGDDAHMDYTGPFGPNWAVAVLPFVDQGNLYQAANLQSFAGVQIGVPTGSPPAGVNGTSWRVGLVDLRIPAYMCPTDAFNLVPFVNASVPGGANGWARGNYGASAGYEDYDHVSGGNVYKSNPANVAGAAGLSSSAVMSSNYGAPIAAITDGTSNTTLFDELRAGLTPNDPRGVWAMGFPGASVVNAGRAAYNPTPNNKLGGINADGGDELQDGGVYCSIPTAALGMGCTTAGTLMTSAMSRSLHTGGVNICMADGSGRFLSDNVDQLTWCRLQARADGQIVGDF